MWGFRGTTWVLPLAKLLPKKAEILQAQKLQVTVPLDAELKDKGNSFALRKVMFWFHTAPNKASQPGTGAMATDTE